MQIAYPRFTATEEQLDYNKAMNAVRIAVEWSYKEVKESFTINDFKRKLRVREAPIGLLYINAVLLRNFKTCLGHGGLVASKFVTQPPSLDRYCTIATNE